MLARRLAGRDTLDVLVARLRAAGVASSPVLSVLEHWRDPHIQVRGLTHQEEIPHDGQESMFRTPWHFFDAAPVVERCGPRLGEHNEFVFGELLGPDRDEVAALVADGLIA